MSKLCFPASHDPVSLTRFACAWDAAVDIHPNPTFPLREPFHTTTASAVLYIDFI